MISQFGKKRSTEHHKAPARFIHVNGRREGTAMTIRNKKGQAIAEAGAGMTTICLFAALVVAAIVNVLSIAVLTCKVNYVAHCAAKVSSDAGWFLGMERESAAQSREECKKRAEEIAKSVAASVGLPAPSSFNFEQTANGDCIVTKVTVAFPSFELPLTLGFLPKRLYATAQGISTGYAYGPTAAVNFEVPTGNGAVRAVQMPALFTYRRQNQNITRDLFGGGGKFNTELGLYQGGLLLNANNSTYNKYWQGFNGTSVSTANNAPGSQHGALPVGNSLD